VLCSPFKNDRTLPDTTNCKFSFRLGKVLILLGQLMNALTRHTEDLGYLRHTHQVFAHLIHGSKYLTTSNM
jgi:hypothetical protein